MKKILFLLLVTIASYGQTYQNPTFGTIKTKTAPTVTSTPHLGTVETDGTISKITPENLPVSTATTNALDLKTTLSAGAFSGFAVTNNGDGTISVGSGIAYLRATNDQYAPLIKYPIAAYNNIPLVDNLNNYIVVSYNGGSPALVLNTTGIGIDTQTTSIAIAAARVGTAVHYVSLVGSNSDPNAKLRNRYLQSEGIRRVAGLAISATGRKIATTAGITYSGLIRLDVAAMNTNTSDTYTLAYNNGSTWTRVTGQTDINNTQYNNAGTLTALNNNNFRTDYIYALVNSPSKLYVILGNTQYNTIGAARLAPTPSSLPVELQQLGVLVGRAIIEKDAVTMEVASPFVQDFAAGAIENHNDLAGLQGGTAGQYNHLTDAQVSLVNGSEQAANKATDFSTVNNTLYPSVQAVKNYADTDLLHKTGDETKTGSLTLEYPYIAQSAVFIGNSITDGNPGISTPSKRYSSVTAFQTRITEVNHGIGSSTMQKGTPLNPLGGVNMQDRLSDIPTKSGTYKYLVFEFGSNDFGWNGGDYTAVNYKIAYRAALDNALSKGWSGEDIYILSIGYINSTGFAFYASLNGGNTPTLARLLEYRTAAEEIATEYNTNFLDVYDLMLNNGSDNLLHTDGLHPNDLGARLIANSLSNLINLNYAPFSTINQDGENSIHFDDSGNIGYMDDNEVGSTNPRDLDLGSSYSSSANNPFGAKIKLVNNSGGIFGFGVSGAAGLEYFGGAQNKHTFYGDMIQNGGFTSTGNILGLQFVSQGVNAAYNFLDRANNANSYAIFGDSGLIKIRSSFLGTIDILTINGSNADINSNGSGSFTGDLSATNYTGGATLTGTPTAPTATVGTSTTQIANMQSISNAISGTTDYILKKTGTGQTGNSVLSESGGILNVGADTNFQGDITVNSIGRFNSLAILKNYTVSTLPTGFIQGAIAYVTDALAPTYLAPVVGGGTVVCPVFYNGTNWVAH